jgi:hypothetical protein
MLMADGVDALPALRPHQKQTVHASATGAMAILAAGETKLQSRGVEPIAAGLTPGFEADEPWLVVDICRIKLSWPPVPEGMPLTSERIPRS